MYAKKIFLSALQDLQNLLVEYQYAKDIHLLSKIKEIYQNIERMKKELDYIFKEKKQENEKILSFYEETTQKYNAIFPPKEKGSYSTSFELMILSLNKLIALYGDEEVTVLPMVQIQFEVAKFNALFKKSLSSLTEKEKKEIQILYTKLEQISQEAVRRRSMTSKNQLRKAA